LINTAEDRTESNNLVADHPEKVKELEQQWEKMLAGFREVAPVKRDVSEKVEVTDH